MIRETIVLLIVASFMIPAAIAEPAEHGSGECQLYETVDGIDYYGIGEYKTVETSSGNYNGVCTGQLDEMSAVPDKAIVIQSEDYYREQIVITPSGHFTWTIHM